MFMQKKYIHMFIVVENGSQFQFKIVKIYGFWKAETSKLVEYSGTDDMPSYYEWVSFYIRKITSMEH